MRLLKQIFGGRLAKPTIVLTAALLAVAGCGAAENEASADVMPVSEATVETAVFAGGCFWCMEPPFDKLDGVISTTSGYIGGQVEQPTYKQVSAGGTGHTEAVQIEFDPKRVSYAELVEVFWKNIDPLAVDRQFCDAGSQYRSGLFPIGDSQQKIAEASLAELSASGRFDQPIATRIEPAATFWPAEDYHQDYYLKNPARYKFYRWNCGRDARLAELWGESTH